MALSFENVTVKFTPDGGSEVTTQVVLEIDGIGGSTRGVTKHKVLNNTTILSVDTEEFDDFSLKIPYDETALEFNEVVMAAYKAKTKGTLSIEFDNMPDGGTNGTIYSGTAYFISYKPVNDAKTVMAQTSAAWEGTVSRTKAV